MATHDDNEQNSGAHENQIELNDEKSGVVSVTTRSDGLIPITRTPTKQRDGYFTGLFIAHLIFIASIPLFRNEAKGNIIPAVREGSWASMVMIITLLGSFFGALVMFLISNTESRESFLFLSIPLSVFIQFLQGNIFVVFKSQFSVFGILLFGSAYLDFYNYRAASENISFSSALLCLVQDICKCYGNGLTLSCVAIVATQTCVLLWWDVYLIDLLATTNESDVLIVMFVMMLSLYWILQFFHSLVSFVIGGCVLWYFVRDETDTFNGSERILLHIQCALSTSLGSVCKGALLCSPCEVILRLERWSRQGHQRRLTIKSIVSVIVAPFVSDLRGFCFLWSIALTTRREE